MSKPIDDDEFHNAVNPYALGTKWPDPLNYDKRIRNLSDRLSDLELAVARLQAKNADDTRSKFRIFRWGGWK